MVNSSTQAFIFSTIDAQQEYTTKLLLFFILLIGFLFMFWYSYKVIPRISNIRDYNLSIIIIVLLMRVLSLLFLFLFPLWFTVFSYRGVALEVIMRYLFYAYGVIITIFGIVGFIFGFEILLRFLGLPSITGKKAKKIFSRRRR